MNTLTITGYEHDTNCEHCGRKLVHGIEINNGLIVGATCFDKLLTKARLYQGKKYRIGSENVIRLAKIAEKGTMKRHQYEPDDFVFVESVTKDGK